MLRRLRRLEWLRRLRRLHWLRWLCKGVGRQGATATAGAKSAAEVTTAATTKAATESSVKTSAETTAATEATAVEARATASIRSEIGASETVLGVIRGARRVAAEASPSRTSIRGGWRESAVALQVRCRVPWRGRRCHSGCRVAANVCCRCYAHCPR